MVCPHAVEQALDLGIVDEFEVADVVGHLGQTICRRWCRFKVFDPFSEQLDHHGVEVGVGRDDGDLVGVCKRPFDAFEQVFPELFAGSNVG